MVNYRVHNSPTFIPILSLINSVHILSVYSFLKINFSMNIFVGFQRMSSAQVFEQIYVSVSHSSHACYMPCSSHLPRLNESNNIWWTRMKWARLDMLRYFILFLSFACFYKFEVREQSTRHRSKLNFNNFIKIDKSISVSICCFVSFNNYILGSHRPSSRGL